MKRIYLIFPILAGIIFGSCGIFVRILTENGIDIISQLFLRFSIALLCFLIIILRKDKRLLKLNKEHILYFALSGICIFALNICYNYAIVSSTLALSAILLASAPVFALIFEHLFLNKKINSIKIISIILVLIGCTFVSGLIEENTIHTTLFGIIAGIGSAIFWAFYAISSRKSIDMGENSYIILFYSSITILILSIPFTDFTAINNFICANAVPNIIFLIMNALFCFVLPYIFITLSLEHLDAGTTTILASIEPMAALVYGIVFYSEIPSLLMICGIIISILGLLNLSLGSLNKSESKEHSLKK